MPNHVVYTIGHSTHQLNYFLSLLHEYAVNCLVDVRSVAASAYNPQYNKEPLSNFLKTHGITYLHFSEEFGAQHTDPNLLDEDGKVDFKKVRISQLFSSGVDRLRREIEKGFVIALMCAESEPFDCHRFSMISVSLEKNGFEVQHILKDKTFISNSILEKRLLQKYDKYLPKTDMFQPTVTMQDRLESAYRLRNKEIAYSPIH